VGCNTAPNGGIAQNLLSDVAVAGLTNGPAPITTSFADTHLDTTLPPNFGDNFTPSPLAVQPRDASGAYLLSPGFYEMTSRSYCLNAGLHGPSSGDGYLYAPLTGNAADIIGTLIRNSDAKPDIQQSTVQLLIWAVLARAKFDSLNSDLKTAAIELLSPQQIYELNGGALGLIPDAVIQQAVASLPANVQQAIATANRMRTLLAQASVSYADAEQLAVPAGSTPAGQSYPEGGWSIHPNG